MPRPFLPLILAFLTGILIAGLAGHTLPISVLIVSSSALIAVMFLFFRVKKVFYVLLCLFFLSLGMFRYSSFSEVSYDNVSQLLTETPKDILVYGDVVSLPEERGRYFNKHLLLDIDADRVLSGEDEYRVNGRVRTKVFGEGKDIQIGDIVVLEGEAYLPKGKRNPAGFDYRRYLKGKGIFAVMTSSEHDMFRVFSDDAGRRRGVLQVLGDLRNRAKGVINVFLRGQNAALVEASLLGSRNGLDTRLKDIFIKTGTMHILAVSGLHVGVIALSVVWLFSIMRMPRKITYIIAILSIGGFAFLTGGRPSAVRAAIMGSFVLMGMMSGRRTDIISSLFLSAFCICFLRPAQLFDPGFILSYTAVLSIIYLTPITDKALKILSGPDRGNLFLKLRGIVFKGVSVSAAIFIGMMPLIAYYFRIITPAAILANIFAVPFLFLLIILGAIIVFTGSFVLSAPIASVSASLLGMVIPVFTRGMEFLGALPFSYFRVPAPRTYIFLCYYAVFCGAVLMFRKGKVTGRILIILVLTAANLFVWPAVFRDPDNMRIVFFDTGRSDAAMIEGPGREVTLIDAGSGDRFTSAGSGMSIIAPYLWQRGHGYIDNIVITHFHDDHVGGSAYLIDNFGIDRAFIGKGLIPVKKEEANNYTKFMKASGDAGVEVIELERGDRFAGNDIITFLVLNPGDPVFKDQNTDSIVLKTLIQDGPSVLFCADITSRSMKDMLKYGDLLKSDIIKIPHHGMGMGEDFIAIEFIKAVDPDHAIIPNSSASKVNRRILKALKDIGAKIHITGETGAVIVDVNNGEWTVRAYGEEY